MKARHWLVVSALVLLALTAGWIVGRSTRSSAESSPSTAPVEQARKVLYYRNPMGLADNSPVPKKDAMGMDYIAVFEGGEAPATPGTVALSPEKIQKLGVRTQPVRLRGLSPSLRASATVQVDETRQYAIAPKFEGWVERLYANQTGMSVRRGQPLLSIYSPQLIAAQNEYRVADAAARKLAASDPASAAMMRNLRDAAQARLRNWDVVAAQSTRAGNSDSAGNLVLTAPADAVVMEKLVTQGARFAPGETILRLADLSSVWLIANVPASSAAAVAIGQPATFQSSTLPGRSFEGKVTFVQPVIDAITRTLAVRVELPNPDGLLRPGLFGDLTVTRDASPAVLTVPRSAVLDSGKRQLVLVQVAEGRFEPRSVVIGERAGDLIEIRDGVREGERVVVSANFLIDAESNLQSALQGLSAHQGHAATPAKPAAAKNQAER
ncbi:MAG: efflux transporter periplasmic adaptor subunit [Gammaproteobacteria bacterium RIFCSPHIGHO2_12_FULL_63_22]|nr:MAG: efflux transporter periplasmic adaptor subunit [Gammaproteobacteria bacterium RIFCSPHIGHO2_12_FULL_63_22]